VITHWQYNSSVKDLIGDVKNIISENDYKTIDIGASAQFWSYPECKFVADIVEIQKEGVKFFNFNIQNKDTWSELISYVEEHGKFDFSICSHTLEDVLTPVDLLNLLPFSFLWNNKYRGNAHHKQIIDVKDDMICIYPKYPFIEVYDESDEILKSSSGKELVVFWDIDIPYKFFSQNNIFHSDGELISEFYKQISTN